MNIETRYQNYIDIFRCSPEDIITCYEAFLMEIQNGLHMHAKDPSTHRIEESSLAMLDSCVPVIPTGKEKGIYYAVDFGGTKTRALRCEFNATGKVEMTSVVKNLRETKCDPNLAKGLLDKKATASMLFDAFADCVKAVMKTDKSNPGPGYVGLTYSFPAKQQTTNSAIALLWSKGFETGLETSDVVIGADVGALLDKALNRNKINAKTIAVLNDTVACLIAGSYKKKPQDPPCLVGLILGTGVNGAFVYRNSKYGFNGIIINTELGNFNKGLRRNECDFELDFQSTNRGYHLYEKMVSGLYLPELVRITILRVFQHEAPPQAWVPGSLSGEGISAMYQTEANVSQVMASNWNWTVQNEQYIKYIHGIVSEIFNRSAALAAAVIAGLCKATGCLQPALDGVTVAVDGSLYVENPAYRDMVEKSLRVIFDEELLGLLRIVIAEDGSGLGAAVLAAAVASAQLQVA